MKKIKIIKLVYILRNNTHLTNRHPHYPHKIVYKIKNFAENDTFNLKN